MEKPTPRQTLRDNLRALMAAHPGKDTIKKVAEASSGHLSNGKVGRITAGSHTTDIDTLQHLARVFSVEPWQLLVENLRPDSLPRIVTPALIAEIRQLVSGAPSAEPSDAVQRQPMPTLGPGLQEAIDVEGIRDNARRKAGAVQKQGGRSGSQGTARTR